MTDAPSASPSPPVQATTANPNRSLRWLYWVLPVLLVAGLGLVVEIWLRWHQWCVAGRPKGTEMPADGLVWCIASMGVTAAVVLAGVIGGLNRLRGNKWFCRWYVRMPVSILKRLLLVLQIGAMGAALYVMGVHYLGIKVIGL